MLLVLRALGASRGVAGVIALLYAYLPYHFTRGACRTSSCRRTGSCRSPRTSCCGSRRPARPSPPTRRRRRLARAGLERVGVAVAAACADSLLGRVLRRIHAALPRRARRGRLHRPPPEARARVGRDPIVAIGAIAVVNLTPTLVYMAIHGQDTAVVRRNPSETEFEGLKISQLVLPVEQHRIQPLADVQTKSTKYTPTRSERGQQLGVIGAIGFATLLVVLLVAIRRDRRGPPKEPIDDEVRAGPVPPPTEAMLSMGVLTVVGILMATISGFSILIFGFGIRELRSWNRISVFIAFFVFATVAYGLDWLRRRFRRGGGRRRPS